MLGMETHPYEDYRETKPAKQHCIKVTSNYQYACYLGACYLMGALSDGVNNALFTQRA